jgi:hypothetical protein
MGVPVIFTAWSVVSRCTVGTPHFGSSGAAHAGCLAEIDIITTREYAVDQKVSLSLRAPTLGSGTCTLQGAGYLLQLRNLKRITLG